MARRTAPWWVFVVTGAFVAYFVLLAYCDLVRPGEYGFRARFVGGPDHDVRGPGPDLVAAAGTPVRLVRRLAGDATYRPLAVPVGVRQQAALNPLLIQVCGFSIATAGVAARHAIKNTNRCLRRE